MDAQTKLTIVLVASILWFGAVIAGFAIAFRGWLNEEIWPQLCREKPDVARTVTTTLKWSDVVIMVAACTLWVTKSVLWGYLGVILVMTKVVQLLTSQEKDEIVRFNQFVYGLVAGLTMIFGNGQYRPFVFILLIVNALVAYLYMRRDWEVERQERRWDELGGFLVEFRRRMNGRLSPRVAEALRLSSISTNDIIFMTEEQLGVIPDVGREGAAEVRRVIQELDDEDHVEADEEYAKAQGLWQRARQSWLKKPDWFTPDAWWNDTKPKLSQFWHKYVWPKGNWSRIWRVAVVIIVASLVLQVGQNGNSETNYVAETGNAGRQPEESEVITTEEPEAAAEAVEVKPPSLDELSKVCGDQWFSKDPTIRATEKYRADFESKCAQPMVEAFGDERLKEASNHVYQVQNGIVWVMASMFDFNDSDGLIESATTGGYFTDALEHRLDPKTLLVTPDVALERLNLIRGSLADIDGYTFNRFNEVDDPDNPVVVAMKKICDNMGGDDGQLVASGNPICVEILALTQQSNVMVVPTVQAQDVNVTEPTPTLENWGIVPQGTATLPVGIVPIGTATSVPGIVPVGTVTPNR